VDSRTCPLFFMRKYLKVGGIILILLLLIFYVFNFEAVNYGLRQAKGQLRIIFDTQPVEELLGDAAFPDSLRYKLELINEIKQFTVDSLGLLPSKSYTRYYDQQGEPILWVVTASEPYALQSKMWKFPVVGEFSYKGHFERHRAEKDAELLKKEGYDVRIGEVSAWSTLGYLSDPVLSSMLEKNEGQLAALIIHELTHGTLFVKNDLEFNENLADFVGDEGARKFLRYKFGADSEQLKTYEAELEFQQRYAAHIRAGAGELDSLFQTFTPEMASKYKDSLKYDLIDRIMCDAEALDSTGRFRYRGRRTVNNAYFTAFSTYQGRQKDFEKELKERFGGNFNAYLVFLKKQYSSLGK
jgi:predicted aminopeptidase